MEAEDGMGRKAGMPQALASQTETVGGGVLHCTPSFLPQTFVGTCSVPGPRPKAHHQMG